MMLVVLMLVLSQESYGLIRIEPGELTPSCCTDTSSNMERSTCCLPPGQTCQTRTYAVDVAQAWWDFMYKFQASLKLDNNNTDNLS